MSHLSRREFLATAAVAVGAAADGPAAVMANEKVGVAVLGSGRGASLARWFARLPDSQVVAICEPDRRRGEGLCRQIEELAGKKPLLVADFRTVLDRKDVDALAVATPDHWHAPATILACMAGKDVYVENVDYDMWLGPAPKRPFNRNRFHGGWHWHWGYGTGDIGNDGVHQKNLINCVKSRKPDNLIADIEEGHYSAMLCHLGNISYRTGRRLRFDAQSETFPHDAEANQYLRRQYRPKFEMPEI